MRSLQFSTKTVTQQQTFFISDLHLSAAQPETTDTFLHFAHDIAPLSEALYVLGDLFEYWVGDDNLDERFHQPISDAFAGLTRGGTALFFMHGNRDFLLGQAFLDKVGGALLPDPTLIDLYGTPTLLMHGDSLCTDDVEYMRFRDMVRERAWQNDFLRKPRTEREALANGLRSQSETSKQRKSMAIMDVAVPTVEAALRRHHYPRLIHGHTHRPAKHVHLVDVHVCERWVLTDWHGRRGGYVVVTPEACEARPL